MSRVLYLKFGGLFKTDERLNEVIHYKQTREFPERIATPAQKARYVKTFKDFAMQDGHLVYTPLKLIVVAKADCDDVLEELYNDPTKGAGKACLSMYKYVQLHYCNITRKQVSDFIKQQSTYQLQQPHPNRVNKPIISFSANQLWCEDLIDLNEIISGNKWKFRYIMTVVDVFSRKVWLERLRTKTAIQCRNAFQRIIARANVKPERLLMDRGTETHGAFATYCEDEGIIITRTRSYAPQSNSICERTNLKVRKLLRSMFINNQNLNWAQLLPDVELNLNSAYHSAIRTTPDRIWTPDHVKPAVVRELPHTTANLKQNAISAVLKSTRQKIDAFKATEYKVGDLVRCTMKSLYSSIRAIIKAGDRKQIVVEYCPQIFKVARIVTPRLRTQLERSRYVLTDLDGNELCTGNSTTPCQFYASDLRIAHGTADMTNAKALKLNQAKKTPENDVYIVGDGLKGIHRLYFDTIGSV